MNSIEEKTWVEVELCYKKKHVTEKLFLNLGMQYQDTLDNVFRICVMHHFIASQLHLQSLLWR